MMLYAPLPTYEDVMARIALFPEGADLKATHSHFAGLVDRGRYDLDVIDHVRRVVSGHLETALNAGCAVITDDMRLQAVVPESE